MTRASAPPRRAVSRRASRRRGLFVVGVGALTLVFLVLSARGEQFRPVSFDLGAARDPRDLSEVIVGDGRDAQGITVREVRFASHAWDRWGRSRPIRIQAFLAVPPGTYPRRSKPIVITAHVLGAHATPEAAAEICRNLDVVALAVSAPGAGASEGEGVTAEDARPLFATVPDVRGSWLHAYTYALLRAITMARHQPEADPEAVVLIGNSIGGVAALVANGVDDRIRGVLAVSASGAQDEFFPLGQALATYRALQAPSKSLALVADYDHGWYFGHGCPAQCMPGDAPRPMHCPGPPSCPARCPAAAHHPYCGPQASYDHHDAFIGRWSTLLRALVARHAARPARPFAAPPPPPTVERRDREVIVRAVGPTPRAVRLAVSDDGGFTYSQFLLTRDAEGSYRLSWGVPSSALVFAEVELDDGVVATSMPDLPRGFRPRVRPFGPQP